MIKRILLDMDDVLNQFSMPILTELVGKKLDYDDYPEHLGYDIVGAYRYFTGDNQTSTEGVWWMMPTWVWYEAPISPQFATLINKSRDAVGSKNVFVCTAPTLNPECAKGKMNWIQNYLPRFLHRNFFITPNKAELADAQTLLIDDSEKNTDAFIQAGGHAWLMPRPWNRCHGFDPTQTIKYLFRNQFNAIKTQTDFS